MSMSHDEMIAVIAHHRDGGKVEYKHVDNCDYCFDPSPCFDFSAFDYRAKPEPLVLWAVYQDERLLFIEQHEETARKLAGYYNTIRTIKKFIEAP